MSELSIFWLAQIAGLFFLIFTFVKMQKQNRIEYLRFNTAANFLFAVHIYFLGIPFAAFVSLLAGLRSALFLIPATWNHRKELAVIFFILFGALFAVNIDNPWLYLLLLGPLTGILAEIQDDMLKTRILIFINAGVWLIFAIYAFSWPGIICETVLIVSNVIGLYRYHIKPQFNDPSILKAWKNAQF